MFAYVGETLRRLRKDRGKTLEEIGKDAGLGRGQLSRIENSHQEATLSTLEKILSSQGVSRREFFRRYELVESEARELERASKAAPGRPGEPERERWAQEIQEVLGKVESFVHKTLDQPRPIAQGAIEVGDLVVLFRVVPKHAEPEPREETGSGASGEPEAPAGPPPRARKKKR
ncbi:MAG TPA: helix-turn-helix transcriptional regulator [Thermoanaerobaculia bacterium]|nr:helix-turn-helix transcriptional regulator [Thermoanaerobaculia bacterium]HSN88325.1 helix-turn-helix transcriptional regulator [Thermoanaerobaculia bacterium]